MDVLIAASAPIAPNIVVQGNSGVTWVAIVGLILALISNATQLVRFVSERRKRRDLIFERSGSIEGVFNQLFGANLGLKGIIFSENKRSLVTKFSAVVTRASDSSIQRFRSSSVS